MNLEPAPKNPITIGDIPELPAILGTYLKCRYDNLGIYQQKTYVSLPHFSYGSSLIDIKDIHSTKWEIRSLVKLSNFINTNKILSWLMLQSNPEDQLLAFSSNLRRKIRKAQSNGSILESDNNKLIHDFYRLFSKQMHQMGSPAMERSFYAWIVDSLGESQCKIFILKKEHQVIGAAILIYYKQFAENCWLATDPQFHLQYSTYLLHWEMIQFCIQHQINIYSFGRSTINSGVHQYKKQWNTEDHILYRNFSHPHPISLRNNPILAKAWKLTPKPITQFIGPMIARKFY